MEHLEYVKATKKIRKILILGSGAVGKTSLTKVLKLEKSLQDMNGDCDYQRTLFVEIDQFKTNDNTGTFQVLDLAGQLNLPIHGTRDTSRFVFNAVDLICYVFANDNAQSLIELGEWVSIVNEYYSKNNLSIPPFILIKNKIDLESSIDTFLLKQISSNVNGYFEISCFNGIGISKLKDWFNEFFFNCNYNIKE